MRPSNAHNRLYCVVSDDNKSNLKSKTVTAIDSTTREYFCCPVIILTFYLCFKSQKNDTITHFCELFTVTLIHSEQVFSF